MPPKNKQPEKKKDKVVVDKTFGMKGKNSRAQVRKQVEQIQAQQPGKSRHQLEREKENALREKQKLEEAKRAREEAALLKPVQVQKVPFGTDPKTILCQFFKQGMCEKGSKCKFSHDRDVGRKVEKRNLYEDVRDTKDERATDTMDTWDEEKLRKVVLSKHGNPKTTTDIVCKYFIEAIESQKFGWFWECPNGGEKCQYRHALPPGFVLKSQKKAADEAAKANTISLEEFLEVERHKLGTNLTPVTPETFAQWKKTRMDKKQAENDARKKAKEAQAAAGKSNGMSGRDLFTYNPEWFVDEDDEAEQDEWDIDKYRRETEAEHDAQELARIEQLRLDDAYREGSKAEVKDGS